MKSQTKMTCLQSLALDRKGAVLEPVPLKVIDLEHAGDGMALA